MITRLTQLKVARKSKILTECICPAKLLTLKAVAVFCLTPGDIKHSVYELCTLSVVTLCPVVSSTSLAKDKVVGPTQRTQQVV